MTQTQMTMCAKTVDSLRNRPIPSFTSVPCPHSPRSRRRSLFALLAMALLLSSPLLSLAATVTNWISFNRHAPPAVSPANLTVYNMRD